MNFKQTRLWLIASIALSLVLSAYAIVQRYLVESANSTVALATEFDTVEAFAAAQGMPVEDALKELKSKGLTHVVLGEETIAELASVGRLNIESSVWRDPDADTETQLASLVFVDPGQRQRVERGLRIRFQNLAGTLTSRSGRLNLPPVSTSLVRSTAIGLNPDQVKLSTRNGLSIIGRFINPNGIGETGVRETLDWAKEMGTEIFLPMGDQVLGRKDSIPATIDSLEKSGILYASAEFSKIGGDASIIGAMPERVVRLHSAQTGELDKLSYVDAVDRYTRAARERNMRVLLLRPVSQSSAQPLSAFGTFIQDVANGVRKDGQTIGAPGTFGAPAVPKFWPMLIALAAMPIVWFAAAQFVQNRHLRQLGGGLLFLVGVAAYTRSGVQISTFLISLAFPVAGYALISILKPRDPILGFLVVSGISVLGGMCIAGMLSGPTYSVQADEFRGVKLSVFLPVLLVGGLFLLQLVDWKTILRNPITWGAAAMGMTILVALALVVARSGNDTGAGASDTELLLRNVLDRVLFVRPRTKEFLIGHPLLMVAVGMLTLYWRMREKAPDSERVKAFGAWTTLALMVSAIGQTSVVNTLTHAHIPVVLSLARIIIGLVIGCILGLILWALVRRFAVFQET